MKEVTDISRAYRYTIIYIAIAVTVNILVNIFGK